MGADQIAKMVWLFPLAPTHVIQYHYCMSRRRASIENFVETFKPFKLKWKFIKDELNDIRAHHKHIQELFDRRMKE
ncbi:hypothetical protein CR513_16167, partial [Mucuna pruriens]